MNRHRVAFWAGPVAAGLGYALGAWGWGLGQPAAVTAGVTAWCAIWWCTEAAPIPVTALIPFAVFPFAGVLDHRELALAYGDRFVLLFLAGFMISRAAEKTRTHLRVAHGVLRVIGTGSPGRVVVGFMLATALCSMWISNTATALIMLPVAVAVIGSSPAGRGSDRFAVALLLAIAYGASLGGVATLVGTPPNGVLAAVYHTATDRAVDFVSWLRLGVPVSVLMLVGCGFVLTRGLPNTWDAPGPRNDAASGGGGGGMPWAGGLAPPGAWTRDQRLVLGVLAGTALAWVTRRLPFGWGGWSVWLDTPAAHDATVGLAAVLVLFVLPSAEPGPGGQRATLLDWPTARDIPWGILILFGGGIAIARAFDASGLAVHIGQGLGALSDLPPIVVIAAICLSVTFLTELTSNTATTTLLMPILAASAQQAGVEPLLFMAPAALSASCAFMLPVATPPNAIVFGGSDRLTTADMARAGFRLNLLGVVVITAVCYAVL